MKKILLLIMLIIPFGVCAESFKVTNHIIDSEIEIAGALSVKELISIEGDISSYNRKLNYYSFGTTYWDGKSKVDYNGSEFYNGYGIDINEVAIIETPEELDFNDLKKGVIKSIDKFDIKNPTKEGYNLTKKDGIGDLRINYELSGKKSIYIKYTITNLVVKHKDVKEVNYTFKNLSFNTGKTSFRLITPYAIEKADENLYNVYLHGNQSGKFQELINANEEKIGVYGVFDEVGEFNFRMTLPQTQVGVDMYLNNSNEEALPKIKKVEEDRFQKTKNGNKIIKYVKYVLMGLGIVVALTSIILGVIKSTDLRIFILLEIVAMMASIFNYLYYKFDYYYIYLAIIFPLIGFIINKIRK